MFDSLQILNANRDFIMEAYNIRGVMSGIVLLASIDIAFKGWAMWRAARMRQITWFILLLIINSIGILPIIYLLITQSRYKTLLAKEGKSPIA